MSYTQGAESGTGAKRPLDDLLHLLAAQVRKFQDMPTDTLRLSIKRTFDKVSEHLE